MTNISRCGRGVLGAVALALSVTWVTGASAGSDKVTFKSTSDTARAYFAGFTELDPVSGCGVERRFDATAFASVARAVPGGPPSYGPVVSGAYAAYNGCTGESTYWYYSNYGTDIPVTYTQNGNGGAHLVATFALGYGGPTLNIALDWKGQGSPTRMENSSRERYGVFVRRTESISTTRDATISGTVTLSGEPTNLATGDTVEASLETDANTSYTMLIGPPQP